MKEDYFVDQEHIEVTQRSEGLGMLPSKLTPVSFRVK